MILSVPGKSRTAEDRAVLEQCILSIAAGNVEAVGTLYEETKTAVYSFALSILRRSQDAEDVLQDVYLRICDSAHTYKPKGTPLSWILAITRNLSLMRLRKAGREEFISDLELEKICSREAVTADDRIVLTAALQSLSSEELQIVTLHAAGGFKHREIAALLQLPLATVLSKYRRALKKLQVQLEGGSETL